MRLPREENSTRKRGEGPVIPWWGHLRVICPHGWPLHLLLDPSEVGGGCIFRLLFYKVEIKKKKTKFLGIYG